MSVDRSWMNDRVAPDGTQLTKAFVDGVNKFLDFAYDHPACVDNGKIRCPCKACMNLRKFPRDTVMLHLWNKGFMGFYSRWTQHGEPVEPEPVISHEVANVGNEGETYQYRDMVMDAAGPDFGFDITDDDDITMEEEPNLSANKFYQLLQDADEPLYAGHGLHSKLSAVTNLLHFKSESGCSEHHFNSLLEFLDEILPKDHKLPTSYYYMKKMVRALGLGYEKIDACEHDCILYYKEHKHLLQCPVCYTSRYVDNTDEGNGKPIARKILRYFPLAPRLQRLYMSSKTSESMRWHYTCKRTPGELRHPSDGEAWKKFDQDHPSFAAESRNVKIAIATDGFNPYGHSSNPHSTWPVISVPYNLPPWMCMTEPYMTDEQMEEGNDTTDEAPNDTSEMQLPDNLLAWAETTTKLSKSGGLARNRVVGYGMRKSAKTLLGSTPSSTSDCTEPTSSSDTPPNINSEELRAIIEESVKKQVDAAIPSIVRSILTNKEEFQRMIDASLEKRNQQLHENHNGFSEYVSAWFEGQKRVSSTSQNEVVRESQHSVDDTGTGGSGARPNDGQT